MRDLASTFHRDAGRVRQASSALCEAVRAEMQGAPPDDDEALPTVQAIHATVDYFRRSFDEVNGGLRRAPKFPSNVPIRLLLRHHARTADAGSLNIASD